MSRRLSDNQMIEPDALSRGAYSAAEGLRLLNFTRAGGARNVSRNTVSRWLRGYDFGTDGEGHSEPLWRPITETTTT
jgi:hypothetical protein